jgi:hypothetical protein
VTRLSLFLLATLVCGEALAQARIDGSNEESFNRTFAQVLRELPPQEAAELNTATPARTEAAKEAAPLAGTQWDVTDDLNGFISHEHLALKANGEVDDGTSSQNHWEQVGNAVRITINDSYAVYLGTADEAKSMQGAAANINGS